MGYQVIFSTQAREDLKEIESYIALDSPQVAEDFGRRLLVKTDMLEKHPEIGRVVPEIKN